MTHSSLGNHTTNTPGSVTFTCPQCQKAQILRTRNEREIVAKYACVCGFTGPN